MLHESWFHGFGWRWQHTNEFAFMDEIFENAIGNTSDERWIKEEFKKVFRHIFDHRFLLWCSYLVVIAVDFCFFFVVLKLKRVVRSSNVVSSIGRMINMEYLIIKLLSLKTSDIKYKIIIIKIHRHDFVRNNLFMFYHFHCHIPQSHNECSL